MCGHPSYSLLKPWKWRGLQIGPSLACHPHHVWEELRSLPPTLATLPVIPLAAMLISHKPQTPQTLSRQRNHSPVARILTRPACACSSLATCVIMPHSWADQSKRWRNAWGR